VGPFVQFYMVKLFPAVTTRTNVDAKRQENDQVWQRRHHWSVAIVF